MKFESTDIARLQPEKGQSVSKPDGSSIVWKPVQTEDGEIKLSTSPSAPSTAYLCVYLDVKRWTAGLYWNSQAYEYAKDTYIDTVIKKRLTWTTFFRFTRIYK